MTVYYTDLWVSYNHFKNEGSGDEPSVKYHSKGMNYSGELGYTIHAATTGSASSQDKVDWYIQPQFQATLKGVKADNFTDWTGNRIKQDGKYNIQLRTGVRVFGRQSAQGNVFVEANWIHNTKKQGVIYRSRNLLRRRYPQCRRRKNRLGRKHHEELIRLRNWKR